MKKTLILLLVLLILGGIYYTSFSNTDKTTIKLEDRSFMGQDSDKIHTMTIKTKARPLLHISKKNGAWYLNRKHRASKNMTDNMLSTLKTMEIKYVPTSNENNTIHERIKTFGIDVKTYDEAGKLLSDFIIGPNTNDEYGTYFLKRGAEQAYVMHVPSHEGGVRNMFAHDIENFRDLNVIDIKAEEIVSISMEYPKDVTNSFTLNKKAGSYQLQDLKGQSEEINQKLAESFFASCENVNAEIFQNQLDEKEQILEQLPFAKLSLELKNGKELWLAMYPLVDVTSDYNTRSVKDVTTRHQRYFVNTNWGDFFQVQSRFLDRFFKTGSHFK